MTYARSFSIAGLLLFASLVYAGLANAQTTSYVPPAALAQYNSSGASSGATTNMGATNGTNMNTGTLNGTVKSGTSSRSGSVLGASTTNPNVPNTGAGGEAAANLFALVWSGLAMMGGTLLLFRKSIA